MCDMTEKTKYSRLRQSRRRYIYIIYSYIYSAAHAVHCNIFSILLIPYIIPCDWVLLFRDD